MTPIDRRRFLRLVALTAATAAAPRAAYATTTVLPHRLLGRTGQSVSLLTLGGAHLAQDATFTDQQMIRIVRRAVDEGITFLDNAWSYTEGLCEERMGKALRDGYRDRIFLMSKVRDRTPTGARQQLEESLRRLQTDHLDLWQFHAIAEREDVKAIYNDGLLDVALEAREQGKIRFIGFSGHTHPDLHLAMIEGGFPWDTVQMPVNLFDPHYLSFVEQVLPIAVQRGIGVIAMKSLGGTPGQLPQTGVVAAAECLRYAMSLPVATVCSGMDTLQRLEENLTTTRSFRPLSGDEMLALLERTSEHGAGGAHESYKQQG